MICLLTSVMRELDLALRGLKWRFRVSPGYFSVSSILWPRGSIRAPLCTPHLLSLTRGQVRVGRTIFDPTHTNRKTKTQRGQETASWSHRVRGRRKQCGVQIFQLCIPTGHWPGDVTACRPIRHVRTQLGLPGVGAGSGARAHGPQVQGGPMPTPLHPSGPAFITMVLPGFYIREF